MVSLAACETVSTPNAPLSGSERPVVAEQQTIKPVAAPDAETEAAPVIAKAPEVSDADVRLLRVKSNTLREEAETLSVDLTELREAAAGLDADADAAALEASSSQIAAAEAKINALNGRADSLMAEADAADARLAAYEADLEADALQEQVVPEAGPEDTKETEAVLVAAEAETDPEVERAQAEANAARLAEAESRRQAARAEADAAILTAKAARLEAEAAIEKANAAAARANAAIKAAAPLVNVAQTKPVPAVPLLDYSGSALVKSLISDKIKNDDVAVMGIISGARKYCGLNWEPGFVGFIDIANSQKMDLQTIATDHGTFLGSATKSLRDAGYTCVEEDLVSLRAINPY